MGNVERVLVISMHVSFTIVVWNGFQRNKRAAYLILAILLHGAVDGAIPFYRYLNFSIPMIEGILVIMALGLDLCSIKSKKYYVKRGEPLKRKVSLLTMIAILCLAFLTGCGGPKLSDDFDQAEVESSAKEVIQMVTDKDSEGLRTMSTPVMQEGFTDATFEQIYAAIDEGGSFKEVTDIRVAGQTDKDPKTEYSVVVAKAEYESKTLTFTISFTTDMKLAGLYFK